MNILMWLECPLGMTGGVETFCLQYMKKLQKKNYCFHVVSSCNGSDFSSYTEGSYTVDTIPFVDMIENKRLATIVKMKTYIGDLIQQYKIDVIHLHANFTPAALCYILLQAHFKLPSVMTLHVDFNEKAMPGSRSLLKSALKCVDVFVAVSDFVYDSVVSNFPEIKPRIFTIKNTIDLCCNPSPVSFSPINLLFVGRLNPQKGVSVLLQAFQTIQKQYQAVSLTIVGDGPEEMALKQLAEQLQLQKIYFIGKVSKDKVSVFYQKASIILMPSIFEPFGLVALEAFMMQRPLIATSVGGLQKIIKHNVTGLLVEKNNPDAIVNAVKRLVDDEAFSLQLAKNAREDALANYSHDTMCEQYEQVYKALCVKEGIKDES